MLVIRGLGMDGLFHARSMIDSTTAVERFRSGDREQDTPICTIYSPNDRDGMSLRCPRPKAIPALTSPRLLG